MRRRPLALVLLLITSIALLRDVPLSAYTSIAYASEAVTGYLSSNSTAAFTTAATGVTTLNSTGFILGSLGLFNTNGNNYVAWAWKKDPTAGVDIVTYTGTGVAHTIAHSLSSAPTMMIVKRTDTAGFGWDMYHQYGCTTPQNGYLRLDAAPYSACTADSTVWNNTAPTASNFTVGTNGTVNANGGSYIAYLWTDVAGFSKTGTYVGNVSTDGPFIYTGFKPKYIMIAKGTCSSYFIFDGARNTYNPVNTWLSAEGSQADISNQNIDVLANGFKLSTTASVNDTATTYIYAAFADYPFERATTNQGYAIASSTRFNGTNAKLTRTPSVVGDRTSWTWSGWVKRSALGGTQALFGGDNNDLGANHQTLRISNSAAGLTDQIDFVQIDTGAAQARLVTSPIYRDPSAWMHIIAVWDSANATAADRARLYVNGSRVTSFSTQTNPSLNLASKINFTWAHGIGTTIYESEFFGGYMADVHFIDGQALTPTSFGQFDSNGNWGPKSYTGAYGTNGFHLAFASSTSPGLDTSGNANNFTNNNIATTDNVADSPTNNFPTYTPINRSASAATLTSGNLRLSLATAEATNDHGTVGVSTGKWYWEHKITSRVTPSPFDAASNIILGVYRTNSASPDTTFLAYVDDFNPFSNGYPGYKYDRNTISVTPYGADFVAGDVVGLALDMDNGTLTFYRNGVSQGVAFSNINSTYPGTYAPFFHFDSRHDGTIVDANFGQGGQSGLTYDSASGGYFKYTPPAGFKALSSANMISAGVSAITKPANYFDAKLYTGTGALQTISSFGFEPNLLWIKDRSAANNHGIFGNGSGNSSGTLLFTKGVNLFGNASVLGTLSKGAGTFVIDHPLDPQNMLLYHSFVESPEPKNIYDGNAKLDQDGSVTIELPAYFMALNKDFRYLASPIGDAMPNLHLAEEVHHKYFNAFGPAVFSIAGGTPGGAISWQITGNRHDPFILAHPIVVEVEKGPGQLYDKGQCLVPSLCQ